MTVSPTDSNARDPAWLGRAGERYAARLLRRAGYRILDRNWKYGRLEIDLVARIGDEVVFVEVKTRRPGPQTAGEFVHPAQRRRIARAAAAWLVRHPGAGASARFDIICITFRTGFAPEVEHFAAAFDATGW